MRISGSALLNGFGYLFADFIRVLFCAVVHRAFFYSFNRFAFSVHAGYQKARTPRRQHSFHRAKRHCIVAGYNPVDLRE